MCLHVPLLEGDVSVLFACMEVGGMWHGSPPLPSSPCAIASLKAMNCVKGLSPSFCRASPNTRAACSYTQ